jgi:hypothetical protein
MLPTGETHFPHGGAGSSRGEIEIPAGEHDPFTGGSRRPGGDGEVPGWGNASPRWGDTMMP